MQPHNGNDRPNSQRSHFQKELLPLPKNFYERELGKLTRPSRGWSRGNCPFHKSKSGVSFSVNLESGGFYCFGCAAKGGDVLAFVRLRDHLSFKAAAQSLGVWADVTVEERRALDQQAQRRTREREQPDAAREAERRRRIQLRDEVHTANSAWKQASFRLSELRKGAAPTCEDEEEKGWEVLSLCLRDLRDTESEYCAAVGLDYE
jgi:hypothetical protein